ncbi:MAG: hypothetical protein LH465_05365 [Sphingomonas bacterium]|nr:hypothetical protein [Sphingomonas bacterium]
MRWPHLLVVLLVPAVASAQPITSSPRPDAVAVTIYRDPNRGPADAFNLRWLNGYALISETRQVHLPVGESVLRFEGVAGGIIPQSAIITGLADGVVERNRDALLLSPGNLLDRSLGQRVHLRRTSRATGAVVEQDALIRTGADGAVVLQTRDGIEALRCSGQAETLLFDEVPPDLSAKPTLSVRTRSSEAIDATITLSYLATGFDWQANYVATLSPAGDRLDLFAWMTLANGDETSFAAAQTNAVAGKLNREYAPVQPAQSRPINLICWPAGTTSDGAARLTYPGAPPPPPPAPSPAAMAEASDIVVTGARVAMKAQLEALGDVKLYRIPELVTVAANSQKQVAMIAQPAVKVALVYRQAMPVGGDFEASATRTLVSRNRTADGLGLPLPAGGLVLFADRDGRPILIGEGFVADGAVGEDVEIAVGEAPGVRAVQRRLDDNRAELVVTNDGPAPIRYEAEFMTDGAKLKADARLGARHGRPLWAVTVPANGSATLRYRIPL